MRYKNILFDLDGTITEPREGIINSMLYALEKYGIQIEDKTTLYKFIGPPLRDSFRELCGFDDAKTEEAVRYYREYYSVHGVLGNDIMPGMEEALARLKAAGCHLYVATSKPEKFAKQILEHLNLADYFDMIAGSLMDGSRDKKELVIGYLLEQAGIGTEGQALKDTVMVGDRCFDIIGARHFGMDNIGVTFGYGDREEFLACGAMRIADTAEEMTEYILS